MQTLRYERCNKTLCTEHNIAAGHVHTSRHECLLSAEALVFAQLGGDKGVDAKLAYRKRGSRTMDLQLLYSFHL